MMVLIEVALFHLGNTAAVPQLVFVAQITKVEKAIFNRVKTTIAPVKMVKGDSIRIKISLDVVFNTYIRSPFIHKAPREHLVYFGSLAKGSQEVLCEKEFTGT